MRIRKLVFNDTPEAREDFALLYQGFMTGGNAAPSKGMEITRREAKILDKLDAISEDFGGNGKCDTCGQPVPTQRVLRMGAQQIELEQPEYDLVKKYFEATPWTVRASRRVVSISDWLASIQPEGS